MNANRIAAIVIGGASLAAWLAAAVTSGDRNVVPPPARTAPAIDVRGAELVGEIARLHERLRPTATPRNSRNVFRFGAPRQRFATPAAVPTNGALADAIPAAIAPPPPLALIGMAEDAGANGSERTAIMTASGQLVLAKVGDIVLSRYMVAKISSDVVELFDTADSSLLRLALKP
jgi:hypothetical protein